jgi:shikimate dehydrogenase
MDYNRSRLSTSEPDRYAVLGNPVEHSLSPWIHQRFAELTAQRLRYDRLPVPLGEFAAALHAFRTGADGVAKGCNVTVPFKFEAFALAQQASARAALAGAANVLSFHPDGMHADNTDGAGLVADIEHNADFALAGRTLLLLGAGGAAAGVLGPLLQARPGSITVANRTPGRALALVQSHAALAQSLQVALVADVPEHLGSTFDLVLNATSSSLSGAAFPVAARVLHPGTLVYDLMYGPAANGFLHWAQTHGARTRDGLGMLVEQAALAFELWRGVRPPSAQVLQELRLR